MFCKSATLSLSSFLFVLLVLPTSLHAGTLFNPAQTYSLGGYGPTSVAIADLNGDGKPDLVVTQLGWGSNNQGLVTILFGKGDGTFNPPVHLDSGAGFATSVAVADLNGDGKLDLVVANCGSTAKPGSCPNEVSDGVVAVFLGNGNGTFQPPTTYDSGGGGAVSVAVADVNLDGKPDVLVGNGCEDMACTGPGGFGLLLGNGDGTFRSVVVYNGVGQGPVAVADVDQDGKPDVVLGGPGFSVNVLLGNGDGTYRPFASYDVAGSSAPQGVALADVNGDGKPDVVASVFGNPIYGYVSVLLGNGNGTFKPAVSYHSGGVGSRSVAVADVDADGKPDVLVANCSATASGCEIGADGALSVLSGKGDGTFKAAVTYGAGGRDPTGVTVGDVNGDSRPDLIATDFFSDVVAVLLNNGPYRTTTILTSSLNPSIYGQRVTWTAMVTTSGPVPPTGTVNFTWSGHSIGTATINASGVATLSKSNLNADLFPLTAVYLGDTSNARSASAILNQVVRQTTTSATLTSSPNPSAPGQAVTFTATISSPTVIQTGPVTFMAGKTVLGTAQLGGGKAKLTISSLSVGSTKVTATYFGNSNIAKSSASVTQIVH